MSRFANALAVPVRAVALAAAHAADAGNWSRAQQRVVARAGVLPGLGGGRFGGGHSLTAGQLRGAVEAIAGRGGAAPVRAPGGRVTVAGFFGSRRYVSHTGIALSGNFMIHSSEQGVYVAPLWEDWRRSGFVWARRIL